MSTKATVLRESRHSEFLQAQRQDPVTHKVFAAGDRVTRCASCLLPFLDQSWDAIGRTHCGQFTSVPLDGAGAPQPETDPTEPVSEPAAARPKAACPELIPMPISLGEVPLTLR